MSRRLLAFAFGLALMTAWLSMQPAMAGQDVHIRSIETKTFPTVGVTVSVQGPSQLRTNDVRVLENDVPVAVTSVEPLRQSSGQGMNVVLALDTSDSMRGAPLETAFAAARAFVQQMPAWAKVGVVTFADRPVVVQSITSDHTAVLAALSTIPSTTAGTALYDGVYTASGLFSESAQRNIILLTDGRNTTGTADLQSAVTAARNARATIFSVSLEGANTDVGTLQELAHLTSGSYVSASPQSLSAAYQALARELSSQYLIRYRSKTPYGAQATLRVEVPGGAADSGFIAPGPHATEAASGQSALERYLQGRFGLATVIVLAFMAAFGVISMLVGSQAQSNRDRQLAQLIPTPPRPKAAAPTREDANSLTSWIPQPIVGAAGRVAQYTGLAGSVDTRLEQGGISMRPGEFLAGVGLVALGGAVLGGLLMRSLLGVVLFAAIAALIPWILLARVAGGRAKQLQAQLPDVLMVIASSLRAGHGFLQALDMVTKEVGEPSAPEFTRVVTEIRLGRPVDEALNAMADRMKSEDFRWAVMAINIQRKVGGNLAELLETVANTIRERQTLRRQVRVLSAEGRLSAVVLTVLPFLMALYLYVVRRDYLQELFKSTVGIALLIGAGILMLIGNVWMRKVVKIDV